MRESAEYGSLLFWRCGLVHVQNLRFKISGRHSAFQLVRIYCSLSSPKNNYVKFILDYL